MYDIHLHMYATTYSYIILPHSLSPSTCSGRVTDARFAPSLVHAIHGFTDSEEGFGAAVTCFVSFQTH